MNEKGARMARNGRDWNGLLIISLKNLELIFHEPIYNDVAS